MLDHCDYLVRSLLEPGEFAGSAKLGKFEDTGRAYLLIEEDQSQRLTLLTGKALTDLVAFLRWADDEGMI